LTAADLVLLRSLLSQSRIPPLHVPMAALSLLKERGDDFAMAAIRLSLCLFGDDKTRLLEIREDIDRLLAASTPEGAN
jgi:hypothetical protein